MSLLNLLIIDDDEVDRMALRRTLKKTEIDANVVEVGSRAEGLAALQSASFDCVFLDYQLPDGDGLTLLRELANEDIEAPVVMMTGQGSEELVVEMLHAGALDYLPKANMTPQTLARVVRNVMRIYQAETAGKMAQMRLAETGTHLQYLIDNNPAIIYSAVPTGDFRMTFVSDNLRHVLGFEPREMLDDMNFWFEHIHPDDQPDLIQRLPRLFAEGGQQRHDYRFRHRDGHYLWMHDTLRMVYDKAGQPSELLGSLMDITERKTMEQALRAEKEALHQAQRQLLEANRHKSEFLANMSHELRTPLNAIIGFAGMLRQEIDGPLNSEQQKSVRFVENGGSQLLALINDVLDLSKIEAGRMELVLEQVALPPLFDEVTGSVATLFRDKGLELNSEIAADMPVIQADITRLRQVLLNLLSNAVKFTDVGGVTLRCQITAPDFPASVAEQLGICTGEAGGPWVLISIQDSGIGIAKADIAKVFEEFRQVDGSSTRKVGGTGLGMPISKRFVEMHGGAMWLESTPGEGTCVYFTLPLDSEERGE